jgi:hypothetical protein
VPSEQTFRPLRAARPSHTSSGELGGRQSVLVDAHTDQVRLGRLEGHRRAEVPGLLDDYAVTRVDEHACHEVDDLLGSGYDSDLLRRALDATGEERTGDLAAQRQPALNVRMPETLW